MGGISERSPRCFLALLGRRAPLAITLAPGDHCGPSARPAIAGPTDQTTVAVLRKLVLGGGVGTEHWGVQPRTLQARSPSQGAGFGDLGIGTKTLLLDSELITSSFQMMTYIPVGNAGNGSGTGHVTLDPSLLGSVKLFTETYLQTQLGLYIPIGGSVAVFGVEHSVHQHDVRSSIGQFGEEDLFRFTAAEAGRYVIDTRGPTDVVMKLFGPNSPTALIAEDDDSGFATNARIAVPLSAGDYWVQVRHYNRESGQGDYSVKVRRG